MTYLLDTDTLSNLIRPAPSRALLARLATTPIEQQATTAISVGELMYGAARLGPHGAFLRERLENVILADLPILSFDAPAARYDGIPRADLERQGMP